ncbi:hypothetical protein [Stigmatella erecta]|uniref:Lipoprotein n=1 Tax=Stigmatella erecta TaxID=83460 RepID=A0A1I0FHN6_9BACT|nr:hypothetical protein [Stigmatella erecta]SET57654.1 hypothetical protein SAMN05443639_103413 [Stigmatella erecta]
MKATKLFVGVMMTAGLLTACGGTEAVPEAEAQTQDIGEQEQSVSPSCPAGYTQQIIWECPLFSAGQPPCHYYYGGYANEQHVWCVSPTHSYDAGSTGRIVCGDCY